MYNNVNDVIQKIFAPNQTLSEIQELSDTYKITTPTSSYIVRFIGITTPGAAQWNRAERSIQFTINTRKIIEAYDYSQELGLNFFPLIYIKTQEPINYLRSTSTTHPHLVGTRGRRGFDHTGPDIDIAKHVLFIDGIFRDSIRLDIRSLYYPREIDLWRASYHQQPQTYILRNEHNCRSVLNGIFFNFTHEPAQAQQAWSEFSARSNGFAPIKEQGNSMPTSQEIGEVFERLHSLQLFKNLVLEGVPGTGKTFAISEMIKNWNNEIFNLQPLHEKGQFAVTFHPSASYEDFVEGLRPTSEVPDIVIDKTYELERDENHNWFFTPPPANHTDWKIKDGIFLQVCTLAFFNPNHNFLLLIDEFNRANLSKVMGELLTTIERSKRAIWKEELDDTIEKKIVLTQASGASPTTQGFWDYSKCQIVTLSSSNRRFFVPENVYIITTLNTTDHSVSPMDSALRRRFAFERVSPLRKDILTTKIQKLITPSPYFLTSIDIWDSLNRILDAQIGPDGLLGHSYLLVLAKESEGLEQNLVDNNLKRIWKQELLPQFIDIILSNMKVDLFRGTSSDNPFEGIIEQIGFSIIVSGSGITEMLLIKEYS